MTSLSQTVSDGARGRLRRVALSLAALGVLCWLGARDPADTCRVRLSLVEAESGREVPGLLRIVDEADRIVAPAGLLPRGLGLEGNLPIHHWHVLPRNAEFDLPRGTYTFSAISGLETEQAELKVDLASLAEKRLSIPLTRFCNYKEEGFRAGNTHLHLMKVSRDEAHRYLRETPPADGLDALFVSYLERAEADRDYISNRLTTTDLKELTRQSGVVFGNGEEHRHNFGGFGQGYGHVMFLNISQLVLPVSIGPGIMRTGDDGIPLARGIDTARRDGATVIWCHNESGYEAAPNWLSGRLEAQNIFDGDVRSNYKDSFYLYLNAGMRVPFSTGTDWFIYDFSRVYVQMSEELTVSSWLKGLTAGRSFITNGTLLDLRVSRRTPGETLSIDAPGPVEISGRARGRVDFGRVEVIHNGEVVAEARTRQVGGHYEAEISKSLPVAASGWFALRTPPPSAKQDPTPQEAHPRNELGCELFAHTSPVYVEVAARPMFDARAARTLLERMKAARSKVVAQGRFEDDSAKARVLDVYDEAIAALELKMRES